MEIKFEEKQVELYKYILESEIECIGVNNKRQINIYVEPISSNTGRLIISTGQTIYQRYFDGAGGGMHRFLSQQTVSAIAYCFNTETDEGDPKGDKLLKILTPIWQDFQAKMGREV